MKTLPRQAIDAIPTAQLVRRRTGKSVLAQFAEMARLIRLPNRISPDEYFAMRLFDDTRLDWRAKKTFLGKRAKAYVYRFNDPSWRALANDKLACLAQLQAFDLPVSRTIAVYPGTRSFPNARRLCTLDAVADFLRREARYPIFSKPPDRGLGKGAHAFIGYDGRSDELVLKSGTTLPVTTFLEQAVAPNPGGTIFQELVVPHPVMRTALGDRLSTVRALMLNSPDGPILHRAVCRIPTGDNMVDNFKHGQLGNMLANVELTTGTISRVVAGTGFEMGERERHPDTGQSLVGLALPAWDALLDVCRRATTVMSGMRIQSWDVALSDRGPLLLEVNFLGDLDLIQIAAGQGIADAAWYRFMASIGAPNG